MTQPLMPKATAVWLIDKTSLTFEQVADFVGMHPLEVQAIADGEVAQGIIGYDPVLNGQLTREEIARCEADPALRLNIQTSTLPAPKARGKGARYTPVSKRNDRPDAIAWLIRHHPNLSDIAVGKLLGTTKETIAKVRDRTHWNSANIKPRDPVILGLCSQSDLNAALIAAGEKPGSAAAAGLHRRLRGLTGAPRPDAGGAQAAAGRSARPAQPLDLLAQPQFLPLQPRQFQVIRFRAGVLGADLAFQDRVLVFQGPEPRRGHHAGISFPSFGAAVPAGSDAPCCCARAVSC